MLPLLIGAGAGVAGGLIKGAIDENREHQDRIDASNVERFSPWTHMKPQPIQRANTLGDVMQFGAAGAAMGQGAQNSEDLHNWAAQGNNPWKLRALEGGYVKDDAAADKWVGDGFTPQDNGTGNPGTQASFGLSEGPSGRPAVGGGSWSLLKGRSSPNQYPMGDWSY